MQRIRFVAYPALICNLAERVCSGGVCRVCAGVCARQRVCAQRCVLGVCWGMCSGCVLGGVLVCVPRCVLGCLLGCVLGVCAWMCARVLRGPSWFHHVICVAQGFHRSICSAQRVEAPESHLGIAHWPGSHGTHIPTHTPSTHPSTHRAHAPSSHREHTPVGEDSPDHSG